MVSFTERAIAALEAAIDPTDFVRVGVVSGGCSGFSYLLEVEEDKKDDDIVVKFGNINVCLNSVSVEMLSETIVDYIETLTSAGFEFKNNKAGRTCGCGSSFLPETGNCPKTS
tara:strand:- start:1011 stop:1349 length:339 start_codon:yes stop_codon:yes gene_type:complete